jgi:hypothetical protein
MTFQVSLSGPVCKWTGMGTRRGAGLFKPPCVLRVSAEAAGSTSEGLGEKGTDAPAANCLLTLICAWNQFVWWGNEASYATMIKMNFVTLGFFLFMRARHCLADKGTG